MNIFINITHIAKASQRHAKMYSWKKYGSKMNAITSYLVTVGSKIIRKEQMECAKSVQMLILTFFSRLRYRPRWDRTRPETISQSIGRKITGDCFYSHELFWQTFKEKQQNNAKYSLNSASHMRWFTTFLSQISLLTIHIYFC